MRALEKLITMLVCPTHRDQLRFTKTVFPRTAVPWPDDDISCPQGCLFKIVGGIPRFVPYNNYASSFGLQWQRYRKTQLDSYTGHPISRERLERCLGMPLDRLKGNLVLEVGAGAGRFTELLAEECELLVSIDLSEAVVANLMNCAGRPYILLQADINSSPLPYRFFDVVICVGVIQHTPSPERTIASLSKHVKPGGQLVIDHYTRRSRASIIGSYLTLGYPIRSVLKRLNHENSMKITRVLTAICDPIRKHTSKHKWLDRIACRFFPSMCYYSTYSQLDTDIIYEWNELDTYDSLTDYWKHFRTLDEIRSCLDRLGFVNICCTKDGNGIEARASYPQSRNNSTK